VIVQQRGVPAGAIIAHQVERDRPELRIEQARSGRGWIARCGAGSGHERRGQLQGAVARTTITQILDVLGIEREARQVGHRRRFGDPADAAVSGH
jgi:hypothetical protein